MDIISQAFGNSFTQFHQMGQAFSYCWFIILPPLLFYVFKILWLYHIQLKYWLALDWVLLEIVPPKNIEKSPKSMEALYVGMQGVEKTYNPLERWVQGQFPDSFSLEMASDGGEIHMYIRSQRKYRHLVEAHLYAQYPDIEINEVPDYVNDIPKVVPNEQWDLWGTDLEFVKDHHAYPIRTYQKFEESVTGKMIDPLAGLAETMSKIPPGQKLWWQISIFPHTPAWGTTKGKVLTDKLKGRDVPAVGMFEMVGKDLKDVLSNLLPALSAPVEFGAAEKKEQQPLEFRLSPGERDVLKAVEENLGKLMFSAKMRYLYIGRREGFDKSLGVSAFMGGIKQFNDDNMNSFKPEDASKTYANYIFKKSRLRYRQRKILRRYRNRQNDTGALLTLSTEELATLFHLPDMQVAAPSWGRIDAKRGGAPANLPVE